MDFGSCHATARIDQGIEYQARRLPRFYSNYRDFDDAIESGCQACSLEIDNGNRTIVNCMVVNSNSTNRHGILPGVKKAF